MTTDATLNYVDPKVSIALEISDKSNIFLVGIKYNLIFSQTKYSISFIKRVLEKNENNKN